jgi:lactam utilization protein B
MAQYKRTVPTLHEVYADSVYPEDGSLCNKGTTYFAFFAREFGNN